ncbi:MAG: outer membrane beta-barrel protein [Gemmatimonadota bacterium]|nr:MAG: outer membrane beta-barrel protein [Gemmatimonadota bacterium]
MLKRLCGIIVVLAVLSATPALAQVPAVGFEFEPYGGVFIPTTDVVDESGFARKHSEGLALGGRVTAVIPGPLAIEGNFMYAFSDVEDTPAGTETSANVYAVSALLQFAFSLPAAPVSFHIAGGGGYFNRSGDAYDGWENKGDFAGIAGLGMKVGLPGIFKIRVDAEGYFYSAALSDGTTEFDSKLQTDIVVTAGLVLSAL